MVGGGSTGARCERAPFRRTSHSGVFRLLTKNALHGGRCRGRSARSQEGASLRVHHRRPPRITVTFRRFYLKMSLASACLIIVSASDLSSSTSFTSVFAPFVPACTYP